MTEQERKMAVEAGLIYPDSKGQGCGNCKDQEKCIPFFDHQNTMMHYNWVNRRCMISLIAVCVTMIIVVFIFATNQTKREAMWQETIKEMYRSSVSAEVDNGQQDADP